MQRQMPSRQILRPRGMAPSLPVPTEHRTTNHSPAADEGLLSKGRIGRMEQSQEKAVLLRLPGSSRGDSSVVIEGGTPFPQLPIANSHQYGGPCGEKTSVGLSRRWTFAANGALRGVSFPWSITLLMYLASGTCGRYSHHGCARANAPCVASHDTAGQKAGDQ